MLDQNLANLAKEIWDDVRPYARVILKDLAIAVLLWLALASFKVLTYVVPVDGWAGDFIRNIHAVGLVVLFGILAVFLAWDVISLYRKH